MESFCRYHENFLCLPWVFQASRERSTTSAIAELSLSSHLRQRVYLHYCVCVHLSYQEMMHVRREAQPGVDRGYCCLNHA